MEVESQTDTPKYKFIDLFAGLGGFHLALSKLGCECVFASELMEDLRKQYEINFKGTYLRGDITEVDPKEIPSHDILCAGFPCQPFSQAGKRQGFQDEKNRGNLFYSIYDIIEEHKPKYVILENVPNLRSHDGGRTWKTILDMLRAYYDVRAGILSPHQFGIPQHRKRFYIVCALKEMDCLEYFQFPVGDKNSVCDINKWIDEDATDYIPLKRDTRIQLKIWDDFIRETYLHGQELPHFPIWAMEFGADYRYDIAPAYQSVEELRGRHGHLGNIISGDTIKECLEYLPVYARTDKNRIFPPWKIRYITQNREFYGLNKEWLDPWIERIRALDNSHQKLEWNCGDGVSPTLYDKIIQFRASGIRVKLPTYVPALNLVGTQIPIFPWLKLPDKRLRGRYMTIHEAARVQGMESLRFDVLTKSRAFEALGNAVNVVIVEKIMKHLLEYVG